MEKGALGDSGHHDVMLKNRIMGKGPLGDIDQKQYHLMS